MASGLQVCPHKKSDGNSSLNEFPQWPINPRITKGLSTSQRVCRSPRNGKLHIPFGGLTDYKNHQCPDTASKLEQSTRFRTLRDPASITQVRRHFLIKNGYYISSLSKNLANNLTKRTMIQYIPVTLSSKHYKQNINTEITDLLSYMEFVKKLRSRICWHSFSAPLKSTERLQTASYVPGVFSNLWTALKGQCSRALIAVARLLLFCSSKYIYKKRTKYRFDNPGEYQGYHHTSLISIL